MTSRSGTVQPPASGSPALPWSLVLLAVVLTANSLLGPLVTGTIEYRYSPSLINQGIGLDAVALVAVVPVAMWAALLTKQGQRAGPVLAFVPATFAAYMAPQYIVGPDYLGLPGNNEQFFLVHLALFIVAVATFVLAWTAIDPRQLVPQSVRSDRARSWVMVASAAFIVSGLWLPAIVDLVGGDPTNDDFLENPTAFLLVGLLDLGIIIPSAVTTAVGLRRHQPWARMASYVLIGWFALVPAAVAAMSIVMTVKDDPNATTGSTAIFVVAAFVFSIAAASLYRPLFRADHRPSPSAEVTRVLDLDLVHRADSTHDQQPISHNEHGRP